MEYNKVANIKGTTKEKHQVQKMNVSNSITSSKKSKLWHWLLTNSRNETIQKSALKIALRFYYMSKVFRKIE